MSTRSFTFRALFAIGACAVPAVVVAFETPAFAQKGGARDDITLAVGETKTLPTAGVKEYSEGVKGIADVAMSNDQKTFVITGRRPGTTTLLLIKNDGSQVSYDIAVANKNPAVVESELRDFIKPFGSVRTRRAGARILLEGTVANEADLRAIQQLVSSYGGQVESLVTAGVAERKLLIRLDFFFVSYEKTSGYNVGIGWPGAIGGTQVFQNNFTFDFAANKFSTATASIVNQPLPELDIASHHGWAKVIKQSSVITANGNEATFQNGGESNFLQTVGLTTGLISVKFGTNVTVLPRYDSITRDVEIKLGADVADLTDAAVSGGPPGRTTTKLETQVTLKLGQALILSGIKTASQRHTVSGLPGLSEIPVLGLLFGSHAQEKSETEGAVFIVPSVVDTVPKSAIELINNAMASYKDYEGEIGSVNVYPKTPPSAR
ncbi:MAG: pilus assembly protein N-terminal domain-containing protein [Polyangiaceae bacterium]|nr:pilus assembly protein N-terminal domain-containing protein [Polyangiaceae bacterium]